MLKTLTLTIVVWLCYFQKVAPVPMTVLHPPPTPPLTPPPPECQRDGKSYPEGFHLKVSPCEFCDCYAGQFQCVIADCFIVQCVDYIQDPNRCCPVCPNGEEIVDQLKRHRYYCNDRDFLHVALPQTMIQFGLVKRKN